MRHCLIGLIRCLPLACLLVALPPSAQAGGPKFVAGPVFFDPAVQGQPLRWAGGQLVYRVDPGPLNSTVDHATATSMVDDAAALWSAAPTAAVTLTRGEALAEDVSGANATASHGSLTAPADVAAEASGVAVIFDSDGAVIDALYGSTSSDPISCQNNGLFFWMDRFNSNATFAHGVILVNGRCATTAERLAMLRFQLERAFGRLLGLDFSQVTPDALKTGVTGGTDGWAILQPASGLCGPFGGVCLPNPGQLRYDDLAALSRLYPVTAANLANFTGKQLTAAKTIALTGSIRFATGGGMQGVNVVARPLDASGNPLYQYTVTAVSGARFAGHRGNPVTGWNDSNGNPLGRWGSTDTSLQGVFDLSGILLPPGVASADYQISFEPIETAFVQQNAVGPYIVASPLPSGTLKPVTLKGLTAGAVRELNLDVADSARGGDQNTLGSERTPKPLPPSGLWFGRLGTPGQADWYQFPMRGGRTMTVVTLALDEASQPTNRKAVPALGAWNAFNDAGSDPVGAGSGLNGWATGESWLQISSIGDAQVRLGIADQRGDGRPDYAYQGWVLYADTVTPTHLPGSGGTITIRGMGFRPLDTVRVGGKAAQIVSISPNEITAIAPAGTAAGSVDVEVLDDPLYYASAVITGGLSYDAGSGDALTLLTAPAATVPVGVPTPFTVQALDTQLAPAPGLAVTFSVASGKATLGCGASTCTVTAGADGKATVNATATDASVSVATAALANGSTIQTQFTGGAAPKIAALTPNTLSVAAGATVSWTVQAMALSSGAPASGQSILWQSASGIAVASGAVTTNAGGIASKQLTVGPLSEGQLSVSTACINGTSQCASFSVLGARSQYAALEALSGATQTLAASQTPGQIVLRLLDTLGNPMAGGTVTYFQSLYAWSPPCPARGRCAQAPLLAVQSSTAISALDGTVSFAPISIPGTATRLVGLAMSGETANLPVSIEQYP